MRLGQCPKCMRSAFRAAAAAWVVAAAVGLSVGADRIALLLPVPAALTLLWLAHLGVFAWRSAVSAPLAVLAREAGPAAARRAFLLFFLRAFSVAALATALPARVMAQGCSCSDPDCSCPQDQPDCYINPARGESFCCSSGDVGCASPSLSWCCPNGTNCYGDNGSCY